MDSDAEVWLGGASTSTRRGAGWGAASLAPAVASAPGSSLVSRLIRLNPGLPRALIQAVIMVTEFPQHPAETRSRS